MMLLNFDHISLGDRLKVALSGDHGMNTRGPAGTEISGRVIECDPETRTITLDGFLARVNEGDEVVEHIRIAQEARDIRAIDQAGDV